MQISLGLPDPRDQVAGTRPDGQNKAPNHHNRSFINIGSSVWATTSICCGRYFFGFFMLGELLIASASSEEESTQARLLYGDVAIDGASIPTMIRVFLCVSKCDQLGCGTYVCVVICSSR